jgi:hypothetical protein
MNDEPKVTDLDMSDVYEQTAKYEGKLDYDGWHEIKTNLLPNLYPIATADTSIFIVGAYGEDDGTLDRLEAAKSHLDDNINGEVYFLTDVIEAWKYWSTKFKIVASYSTHIVGVYEHSDGGHVWEAGYLDHQPYRDRTYILKRDYDRPPKDEPFDPMFGHFMQSVEDTSEERYYEWCLDGETNAQQFDSALDGLVDNVSW